MEKRRHHHVWKHYLEAWAVDERVWCLMNRTQIRQANAVNLGVKNHFYRLKRLTVHDRKLIAALIQASPMAARPTHLNFIRMFDGWHELRDALKGLEGDTSEAKRLVEQQIANAEEDYHSKIEGAAIPVLERLRAGDAGVLSEDDVVAGFAHFLAVQNMRTSGVRSYMLTPTPNTPPAFDPTGAWAIASHILAVNVGSNILSLRRVNPFRLITNATDVPFITADQPVTNLQATADRSPPEYLSLYYPISPRHAVFIDDAQNPFGLEDVVTLVGRVHKLNRAMVDASHSQVYAQARACLEPYQLQS